MRKILIFLGVVLLLLGTLYFSVSVHASNDEVHQTGPTTKLVGHYPNGSVKITTYRPGLPTTIEVIP